MGVVEVSYGKVFKNVLKAVNPIKKKIIKTECLVHKFINNQAVEILYNDGHLRAFELMDSYINQINSGVVWADQDFKSSNHFYNPHTQKGLYGSSNAFRECMLYYTKAINKYFKGDINRAMFYLGAACHILQDLTVPQHVNVNLLKNHRKYELWVIRTHLEHDNFRVYEGGVYLDTVQELLEYNSRKAISAYSQYSHEENLYVKFYGITSIILVVAQKSTAGLMLKFYKDIQKISPMKILKDTDELKRMMEERKD